MCDKNNIVDSPAMLCATIELMTKVKDLNSARSALKDLKHHFPTFKLDDYKIINLAKLYIEENKMDAAKKLLESFAKQSKKRPSENTIGNILELQKSIVFWAVKNEASENVSEKFLDFLVDLGYCSYSNKTLGPVIKEYIEKHEIENAVKTFINFTQTHKVAPHKLNLMALLIEASNNVESQYKYIMTAEDINKHLQFIVEACKTVHKNLEVNTNLVAAFALAGTEQQLRKLLLNPNINFDAEKLTKNLLFQIKLGKVSAIVKLARAGRGLSHQSIQEQPLYDLLLDNLVRENDCNGAIELIDEITSGEDVKLSRRFVQNASNLFTKNNLDVPSKLKLL